MKVNSGIFGLVALAFIAICCSKSEVQPTPTPNNPTPPIVYTDPAQHGTPFGSVQDTPDIVMYEINLRAFSQSGTFSGILPRLDSIKALGVNTIWLMPIYPVGQLNSVGQLGSPYSVKNYKEVNSEFGTLDNLRTLVDSAHAKGMAVILDWVANHTSWDNPWITNVTWYTRNSSGAIVIPPGTNWQDVADLDYSSTAMKRAMFNAMKYWILAANVDGYRCDYADGVPYEFWKAAIDTLHTIPGRKLIMLAEGARSDHFIAGFQLNYAWDYFAKLKDVIGSAQPAAGLATSNTTEEINLPAGSAKLRFTANHDEVAWNGTPLSLFNGKDGSMAAFVLAAYMGGVPLIYNGQEVGCPVMIPFFSKSPIDWTLNPDVKAEYKALIKFRKNNDPIKRGTIETYTHADISAFKRVFGSDQTLVLVNTRNSTINYTLDAAVANSSWTNALDNSSVNLGTQISLQAYEYLILKK